MIELNVWHYIVRWLLFFFVLILRLVATTQPVAVAPDLSALTRPGPHTVTLRVDDRERSFYFVTPKGFKAGQTLPLVFCFHGATGSGGMTARIYGWAAKADAENFFAVFPQGLPSRPDVPENPLFNATIWRDDRPGNRVDNRTDNVDDFHFFATLLAQLQAALPIDPKRIYITGFSNGAAMTFALGGRFSDRIAAIAPVSSESYGQNDKLTRPLPVYYLAGTADPLVLYRGGTLTTPWGITRTEVPVQDSVDAWVRLDGCPPKPEIVSDKDGVRVERYGPGTGGVEIIFTTIAGNGHHWPGSVEPLRASIVGPSLDPFPATDRIWDFFLRHPLK